MPTPVSAESRSEENLSAAVERYLNKYFGGFADGLQPPCLYHRILRQIEYPLLSAALAATHGTKSVPPVSWASIATRYARKSAI
jgi:two-component system, NtrC family, nitrogen regulation response regulator GlnG